MRVLRAIALALGVCLAIYVVAATALFVLQRRFVFPGQAIDVRAEARPRVAGMEVFEISTASGSTEAWYLSPLTASAPALIFAHGNGEVVDWWAQGLDDFRRWGLAVLLVEYPGYGRSVGAPSESAIGEAMDAA